MIRTYPQELDVDIDGWVVIVVDGPKELQDELAGLEANDFAVFTVTESRDGYTIVARRVA